MNKLYSIKESKAIDGTKGLGYSSKYDDQDHDEEIKVSDSESPVKSQKKIVKFNTEINTSYLRANSEIKKSDNTEHQILSKVNSVPKFYENTMLNINHNPEFKYPQNGHKLHQMHKNILSMNILKENSSSIGRNINHDHSEVLLGKRPFPMDKNNQMLSSELPQIVEPKYNFTYCSEHVYMKIEAICTEPLCLKELCTKCILEHQNHISHIKHIDELLPKQIQNLKEINLDEIENTLNKNEDEQIQKIDVFYDKLLSDLKIFFEVQKDELIIKNNFKRNIINTIKELKDNFSGFYDQNEFCSKLMKIYQQNEILALKESINFGKLTSPMNFYIEDEIIMKEVKKVFSRNFSNNSEIQNLNSTEMNKQKYLHWFEWGDKFLHLYNIIDNSSRIIKFDNGFTVPTFSRSINTPSNKIYLIGGESPENTPRNDVYCYDIENMDNQIILEQKSSMPFKKYDFSICFMNGFIYILCGKDDSGEAIDSCER